MQQSCSLESKKTLAYLLPGPFFLCLALSFFPGFLLLFVAVAGLLVCWQWRMRGFFVAVAGLILVHFTSSSSSSEKIIQIVVEISVVLSWLITTLCLNEISEQVMVPERKPFEEQVTIKVEPLDHNLQQLRRQFEEKSAILHKTRKDLFHQENAYLALQKEMQHRECDILASEKAFLDHIKQLEEEKKQLEAHTEQLQDIISSLTN